MASLSNNRPQILEGITEQYRTGCGQLYVTVNYRENCVFEVFTSNIDNDYCSSQLEILCRAITCSIQAGADIEDLIAVLKGLSCKKCKKTPEHNCYSCSDAIGRCIERTFIYCGF